MPHIKGIYVPGLGDHRTLGQDKAVEDFSKYGLDITYHAVGWAHGNFDTKLKNLHKLIDELHDGADEIVLMGASAGAGAVLNAYQHNKEKVRAVICISGKIQNPDNVSEKIYEHSPAFKQSLDMLQNTLASLTTEDKAKILTTHAFYDMLIPAKETRIPGTKAITIPIIGHVPGIILTLVAYKKKIATFVRSR